MDKEKIESEFHSLLDEVADGIEEKLDIAEAVRKRSSSRTAGKLAEESDTLQRKVVRPVIESHRRDLKNQFSEVVEAVENGKTVEDIEGELLEKDIFHNNLKGYSEELKKEIMERFEHLHGVIQVFNESDENGVWESVEEDFSEEDAREFIQKVFGFTENLEKYQNRLEYKESVRLSDAGFLLPISFEVDYTPEAIDVMKESEDEVREKLESRLDRIYSNDQKDD